MKVYTASQIKELEARAERLGITRIMLMENAGRAVSDMVRRAYDPALKPYILAVCGLGNNGGDTIAAARHLNEEARVRVVLLGQPSELRTEEARYQWKIAEAMKIKRTIADSKEKLQAIAEEFRRADIILDGIFGTGVRHPIREPYLTAISLINSSRALKVSVDIPSGLDPDTGEGEDEMVKADAVISFYGIKKGMISKLHNMPLVIPVRL